MNMPAASATKAAISLGVTTGSADGAGGTASMVISALVMTLYPRARL